MTIGSASIRRATNTRTSRVATSSDWASSITSRSGAAAAASQSRLSVANATRKKSGAAVSLSPKVPSSASPDHGAPFAEIFERYQRDFYKIDPLLFSPAEVWLTSASSGRTFHSGHLNLDVLAKSLYS